MTPKGMPEPLRSLFARLEEAVLLHDGLLVAFSGGVDSGLLAFVAHTVLGPERSCIVTSVSPSLPEEEREFCAAFAREHGLNFHFAYSKEFSDERYLVNDSMRCYWCKNALFDEIEPIARDRGLVAALGVNTDDLADFRPGQSSARERGAVFPLVDAGLDKADVRALARWFDLSCADKPASACLSSRIPFGTKVSIEALSMVERAERFLKELGFAQVRVRNLSGRAKVQVEAEDVERLVEMEERVRERLLLLGFDEVTLDLEGFTSGAFARALLSGT